MITVDQIQDHFGIHLPDRHISALNTPNDPIHEKTILFGLTEDSDFPWILTDKQIREDSWQEWPEWLIPISTEGCGDYFAYDTRQQPYKIYYIDPLESAQDSIAGCIEEDFVFDDFDAWYKYQLKK